MSMRSLCVYVMNVFDSIDHGSCAANGISLAVFVYYQYSIESRKSTEQISKWNQVDERWREAHILTVYHFEFRIFDFFVFFTFFFYRTLPFDDFQEWKFFWLALFLLLYLFHDDNSIERFSFASKLIARFFSRFLILVSFHVKQQSLHNQ